jgi:hypothetical protein
MSPLRPCPLPPDALLSKYTRPGSYTDCFTTEVAGSVSQQQFIEAFYTGRVFKLERLLIKLFLSRPSTDEQVRQLARGEVAEFSAWRVEGRTPTQLLMCDVAGSTRSWLMVSPAGAGTTLYFGSAVVGKAQPGGGTPRMGFVFGALLGFHKIYSRVLLSAARARLANRS